VVFQLRLFRLPESVVLLEVGFAVLLAATGLLQFCLQGLGLQGGEPGLLD